MSIKLKDTASINIKGNATTATALTSNAGTATQPIYFSEGKPVVCTYTLSKSVPSNAVFTDTNTTYSAGTGLSLSGTSFSVTYGTSAGTACQGNDSRLSNSRPASDVYSWAKASSKPSYTYSEVGAAPSSHTHSYLPLSGGSITTNKITMGSAGLPLLGGGQIATNNLGIGCNGIGISGTDTRNDGAAIYMENSGTESNKLIIALGDDSTQGGTQDYIAFRYYDTSGKATYESKVPFKSGTIALTSDIPSTISWTNVSGKPSTFTPSSHTHSEYAASSHSHSYVPLSGGTMTGTLTVPLNGLVVGSAGNDTSTTRVIKSYGNNSSAYINFGSAPSAGNCAEIAWTYAGPASTSNYTYLGFYGGYGLYVYYNNVNNLRIGTASSYNTILHSGNWSSHVSYIPRDRGSNSVTTLTNLPVTKSTVIASLSAATSISLAAAMNIGESITVLCTPSASFTQPIPTSGSFKSMDGGSLSVTSGKDFEINILCYASGKYSISCKTAK